MNDLPVLFQNVELPAEQQVTVGEPNNYIGIYAVPAWITVELVRPKGVGFGDIEKWWPIFRCEIPHDVRVATGSRRERYFEIYFRGAPSDRGRFGDGGACSREVVITQITKVREGRVREWVR